MNEPIHRSTEGRVAFNINNTVRVKLTPVGRAELQRQHDELNKLYPRIGPFTFRVDAEGYSEFQLWSLMEQLGHMCHMGGDIPFETDIQFAAKDLR